LLCLGLPSAPAWAANPKEPTTELDQKEFFRPELYISGSHVALDDALPQLANRDAWDAFTARNGASKFSVYLDGRSGALTNLTLPVPLIPGSGVGNSVSLATLSRRLGREVAAVDAAAVSDAFLAFVRDNRAIFGIDVSQLGEARTTQINEDLWQISIPQTVAGIRVRDARLAGSISHGNLVVVGTEIWGDAKLEMVPTLTPEQALEAGFAFAGGRQKGDVLERDSALEVIPYAPTEFQNGETFGGPIGKGYAHRLVYTFVFSRPPELARWETMVDARTGEVLAFQDINHYADRQVSGGVYPVTSTGVCSVPNKCGVMQPGWPMPFANTGLAAPNNFADSGGIFDWTSGTTTTTLSGDFVRVVDTCGAISLSSTTGTLAMGGTNGQHDCTTPGIGGAGNTAASRSAFYEVNKIAEMARGYLPGNNWLANVQLTANVNIVDTCNGFWNGSTINFFRSGGGCRNTGELAGVFDHEWGHGMDDNDANGSISNSGEGYADIAAIYRFQDSCVGHGFFLPPAASCGLTADGTGRNVDEDQTAGVHCATDCSGVRDADYRKHSDGVPDTALGHVCSRCNTGPGPCGRQVHCAAAPQRQAAWDLVAQDLPNAGFSPQTSFVIGNRLFYQGSGNIGTWYACTCGGTSNGCGATNGYMQWITADDDNGNINDGTPHRTAIFNAFNRHGIACATPAAQAGCASPPAAPTLSANPTSSQVALSWNAVSGASSYWVMRTEGVAGCNNGKAKIATVTGTSFTDLRVANDRPYYYNVVAQAASQACHSQVSNCVQATPGGAATPDFSIACSPSSLTVAQGGTGSTSCTLTSINGFASSVALSCGASTGVTCSFNPASVTPTGSSTLTLTVAGTATTGARTITVNGTGGSLTRSANVNLTITPTGGGDVFFDDFEGDQGWTRTGQINTATTGLWERANPEPTSSGTTALQNGTTPSGVNDLVTEGTAGASAGVNDVDGGTTSIISPPITLPTSSTLNLSFSWYLATLNNATADDFFRVSIASGSTTTTVFQQLGAAVNRPGTFATANVSLNAFSGQTIRILIQAADAGTGSLIEAAVDNVRITQ
jgi:hypothetical protein